MLLTELAAVRIPGNDVTYLYGAYASHLEHTRHAYVHYCTGLHDAIHMCNNLQSCAPLFAHHVQVLSDRGHFSLICSRASKIFCAIFVNLSVGIRCTIVHLLENDVTPCFRKYPFDISYLNVTDCC